MRHRVVADVAAVEVDAFVKKDRFETIKISPTGQYYAARHIGGATNTGEASAAK